jgi:outer membrane protein assembly factor BamB
MTWTNALAADGNSAVYSPVVDRGLVVVTVRHFTNPTSGGVVALDAATGGVRWRQDFPSTAPGRGSGSYGRAGFWHELVIAASDDGTIYAMNRETGAIVWTASRLAEAVALNDQRPILVIGDIVVVGSDRPLLVGLNAATGIEQWRLASEFGSVNGELGTDGTYVYLVYASLQLSAIEPSTGKIMWTSGSHTVGNYVSYPVTDAERVYVPGLTGYYAIKR